MDPLQQAREAGIPENAVHELRRFNIDSRDILEVLAAKPTKCFEYSISAEPGTAATMEWLQSLGLGKVTLGRRGYRTRFESRWDLSLLAKIALTGKGLSYAWRDRVARGEVAQSYTVGIEKPVVDPGKVVTRYLTLADDVKIKVELPAGLDHAQASQLARAILSFPDHRGE